MENKPNENVNKNKIKYIVGIIILIGIIAIIAAGLENEIRNKPKDGEGTGMFEKNSKKILMSQKLTLILCLILIMTGVNYICEKRIKSVA